MSEWRTVPLTDVLEFREGPGILAKDFRESGIPLIRLAGLKQGASLLTGCNFLDPEQVARNWAHFRIREGDVLLSTSASLGEVAIVDRTSVGAIPYTGIIAFRPLTEAVDKSFVSFMLTTPSFKAQIEAMGVGSVMKHFGPMHLRQMSVSFPEFRAQKAIAEVLGVLDDKIASNIKLAETADALAGAGYDASAVSLDMQPMSEVLSPILGGTPPRSNGSYWAGSARWASAKDVTAAPFAVVMDTQEKITELASRETKAKPLPAGSVILTARGTVGVVARLGVPGAFNQSCYGFAPGALPPGLLYFAILRAAQQAKSIAHGSVFDTITMKSFNVLQVPVFGERARAIEELISPLLDLIKQIVLENQHLRDLRDTLLPQLMSGKLRVKDAERVVEEAV